MYIKFCAIIVLHWIIKHKHVRLLNFNAQLCLLCYKIICYTEEKTCNIPLFFFLLPSIAQSNYVLVKFGITQVTFLVSAYLGHTLLERYGMTEIGMALSNPLHGPRLPVRCCCSGTWMHVIPQRLSGHINKLWLLCLIVLFSDSWWHLYYHLYYQEISRASFLVCNISGLCGNSSAWNWGSDCYTEYRYEKWGNTSKNKVMYNVCNTYTVDPNNVLYCLTFQ